MKKMFFLLMLGNLCFMTSQAQNKYLIKVYGAGGGSGSSTNAIDTLKRVKDSIYGRVAGGFKFQFKDTIPALKSVLARGNNANSSIYLLDTVPGEPTVINGITLEKSSSNDSRIGFFTAEENYNQYLTKQGASQRGGTVYLPLQTTTRGDTLVTVAQLGLYVTGTDSQYLRKQASSSKSGLVYLPFQNNINKKDTLATLSDVRGAYTKYVAQIIDTGTFTKIVQENTTGDTAITITSTSNLSGVFYSIVATNGTFRTADKIFILLSTGVKSTEPISKAYISTYKYNSPALITITPQQLGLTGATGVPSGILNISVEIRIYQ